MEKKKTDDKKKISELETKISELEKQISKLKQDNKELKNESERHKRMALYMEGRHKDLWDERRIMLQDILRFQKQIDNYSIANNELFETNFKLSQKLKDITGKDYDVNEFIDASTQTGPINNQPAKTRTKCKNKDVDKNH